MGNIKTSVEKVSIYLIYLKKMIVYLNVKICFCKVRSYEK